MPSGKTHDNLSLLGLPAVLLVAWRSTQDAPLCLALATGYLFGSFMFGPDLDTRSVQYRRWGVLRWIWLPYRYLIPHRSRLSHGFILGPALRFLYIGLWAWGLLHVMDMMPHIAADPLRQATSLMRVQLDLASPLGIPRDEGKRMLLLACFCGGIWLGSILHTLSDFTVSFVKRSLR